MNGMEGLIAGLSALAGIVFREIATFLLGKNKQKSDDTQLLMKNLKEEVERLSRRVEALEIKLEQKDVLINELTAKNASKDVRIQVLEEKNESLKHENRILKSKLGYEAPLLDINLEKQE